MAVGQIYHDQKLGIAIELVKFEGKNAVVSIDLEASSCSDTQQNGDETDMDCGGSCGPCSSGKSCNNHWDCKDYACEEGTCVESEGGLIAEYYTAPDFEDFYHHTTVPTVDFDAAIAAPPGFYEKDDFSIRYVGKVIPRFSETYTFTTRADDQVSLWVNGFLLIDDQPTGTHSASLFLDADEAYDIVMEYEEYQGDAHARIRWSSASQLDEVIPSSRLIPSTRHIGNAVYLGPHASQTTVAPNGCVMILDYPSWWQYTNGTVRLQSIGEANYPLAFSHRDTCNKRTGSGLVTQAWQTVEAGAHDFDCPVLIQFFGDGPPVTFSWY